MFGFDALEGVSRPARRKRSAPLHLIVRFLLLHHARDATETAVAFAARWASSARAGERPVLSRLKAAKMPPVQIAEAQRLASEWKPK